MSSSRDPRSEALDERERALEQREAALRAREEHQSRIGPLGAHFSYEVEVDSQGKLIFPWKPGPSEPIAGYQLDEVMTPDWTQYIHADDRRIAWELLGTALREGHASGAYRLQAKDGELRWLKNSVRRVDQDDRTYLLGIVTDVTDQRQTKQALRESEDSFEALFRAAPVVMIISSLEDGRFVDVNDRFTAATGYSRAEAIGRTATELGLWRSTEQRDDFRELRQERAGKFEGIEAQLWAKSDEPVVALLSAEVVRLGGRACAVWHAVDITARKRAESELALYRTKLEELVAERTAELERSRQQLRHSERLASVGTLAAGIAHQINNPVGVIMAATQHALDCEGDPDAAAIWLNALRESERHAQRCARIVRSVLQFSRDEPAQKWEENLRGALRRACSLTRSYAQQRGASLSFQDAGEAVLVRMNPVEMEQVLVNVLRNALESREHGAKVSVSIDADSERARVWISDDGRGISEGVLSRVFDPFFTTRLEEGGTGLGLSVAHGIVADHQGSMEISSPEAGGCTVKIELPVVQPAEPE